jgi:hypothetical protein
MRESTQFGTFDVVGRTDVGHRVLLLLLPDEIEEMDQMEGAEQSGTPPQRSNRQSPSNTENG